jgi:transcriptional regulator with GAF, ATPase, and Fis domain
MVSNEPEQVVGFDRFLAELSARFVSLPGDAVEREIHSALEQIGSLLDVDRLVMSEFAEDGESATVRHSWAAPGVEPIRKGVIMGPTLPQVFAAVRRGDIAKVPDTRAAPPGWEVDQQEFRRSGARAHLSMRFAVAGRPVGVFSVVSVRHPRSWTDDEVERLNLIVHVFANALSRRDGERRLQSALARVKELQARLQSENVYLREEISAVHNFSGIVGHSAALRRVLAVVEQVAPTDVTVLVRGDTGTGKELIVRALHAQSGRNERPLIKVNCAALPSSLAESEVFGHEKGAFTGAVSQRTGRFELADGGTIFLDEVGDLSADVQAKLLRVLQEGEFERLGSAKTRSTDVRVLAATSRNLEQAVEEGSFRADLYYRLRVVPIDLPPLREHRDDIPILIWHFIEKARARHGRAITEVPSQLMEALVAYDWPGNIRELENVIERAVVLSPGTTLSILDPTILSSRAISATFSGQGFPARATAADATQDSASLVEDLAGVERSHIVSVLEQCGWKVKGPGNAAERLGLNPSTLRGRMRKLGIARATH